jgi:hypothetical protein
MMRYLAIALILMSAGAASASTPEDAQRSDLVGKVWASTDASAAPGTFRIFLADGTLVMDSCGETYRLSPWRRIDDRHIDWTEDGIRIGAEIAELTADRLRLRIQLRSEIKEESYRPAKVPSVCPDMPRREGPVPGHQSL